MATVEALNTVKSEIFGELQNDVVPLQQTTMATETLFEQSGDGTKQNNFNSDDCGTKIISTVDPITSGPAGVSALSLNEKNVGTDNPCNSLPSIFCQTPMNNNNNGKNKGKRRRRKTKSKGNGGGGGTGGGGCGSGPPYRKSNWKFQRSILMRSDSDGHPLNQAPCNTNKFLMEEHMPEMRRHRNKDSSFSADTEENPFQSMSEDEEFLTKEFSSVYEDARRERLEGMSRTQLIHEYLQLEANYDRLSKNLQGSQPQNQRWDDDESQSQNAEMCQLEINQSVIGRMEDQIKELTAENLGKPISYFKTIIFGTF